MKNTVRIIQAVVAILFIFSGLVKANDPLGLSFKMQEFFELWSAGMLKGSLVYNAMNFFHDNSLALSVMIITVEIIAGVALLIGWKKDWVLWSLLVLIIFFTFLTGYAFLSGKFTNCGCFGDCLPISPFTSFLKDIALLAMITFLISKKRYVAPVFLSQNNTIILAASLLICLGLQLYVLNYLPVADCLPFKKDNNIAEKIKPPAGSVPDSFAIRFMYEKGGKRFEFAPENLPADFTTYKFIDRKQTLVRKGNAEPAIKGFSLIGITGEDSSQVVLSQPLSILVFAQHFNNQDAVASLRHLADTLTKKGVTLFISSPSLAEAQAAFGANATANMQFFNSDFTVVRTVARTNPTILILNKGIIWKKYSARELRKVISDLSTGK